MNDLANRAHASLNRLAKWRAHFAGWQLGTRLKGDPESDAVRDHREVTILLRAEVSALVGLLLKTEVFTLEEWTEQLLDEAEALSKMYEEKFPGVSATDHGLAYDPQVAGEHMKNWRP